MEKDKIDMNYLMNPPKEVYSVRVDSKDVETTNAVSWEVCFYDKDLNKSKFVMQFHPSLRVMIENLKVIFNAIGYEGDLSQIIRTVEERNHIDKALIKAINRDESTNFQYKTIIKKQINK